MFVGAGRPQRLVTLSKIRVSRSLNFTVVSFSSRAIQIAKSPLSEELA
jgi:hypothetical protein